MVSDAAAIAPEALQAFVGRDSGPIRGRDAVNAAMIRHWCVALGDVNPVYADAAVARQTIHGDVIAPPAMLQAWTMPEPFAGPGSDAVGELYALLDSQGFGGIAATDSEQDYHAPVRIGDVLTATKRITAVSGEKQTALGRGYFITSTVEWVNQAGVVVGTQLHRVLKYQAKPIAEPAALRPRPNATLDTAFFFEAAKRRELLIQCCDRCDRLQHPPMAACRACGSLALSPRRMSGRGTLFSFTIVHAPVTPPFEPPYPVILVELEEGPRVVSELHGVPLGDIKIGMPLRVDFLDCDADLSLPIFRAVDATDV